MHSLASASDAHVPGWASSSNGQTDVPASLATKERHRDRRQHLLLTSDGQVTGFASDLDVETSAPPRARFAALMNDLVAADR